MIRILSRGFDIGGAKRVIDNMESNENLYHFGIRSRRVFPVSSTQKANFVLPLVIAPFVYERLRAV